MGVRKTSFYHTRYNRVGINQELAAALLGVTVAEVQHYDEFGCDLAERFLLLWDKKNIGYDGWEGFKFSRGVLCYKKLRFTPQSIQHLVYLGDQNDTLKRRLSELENTTRSYPLGNGKILEIVRR